MTTSWVLRKGLPGARTLHDGEVRRGEVGEAAIVGLLVTLAWCSGAPDKESSEEAATHREPPAPHSPSPPPSPRAQSAAEASGGTGFDPHDVLPWNPQGRVYEGGDLRRFMLFKGGPDFMAMTTKSQSCPRAGILTEIRS
jgi:hypothetical protein